MAASIYTQWLTRLKLPYDKGRSWPDEQRLTLSLGSRTPLGQIPLWWKVEASYSLALFPEFMHMELAVDTKPEGFLPLGHVDKGGEVYGPGRH